MWGWTGEVKLFNGRYWEAHGVRVEAHHAKTAVHRAVVFAVYTNWAGQYRRSRWIEGVQVTLTRYRIGERADVQSEASYASAT